MSEEDAEIPKKKILVVDDSKILVKKLSMMLEKQGYEAIGAFDGREGLAAVRTYKPNLIVADVVMPGMNGFQMSRTLKNDSQYQAIPIIIMSGTEDIAALRRSREGNADAYLQKPFPDEVLLAEISKLLN